MIKKTKRRELLKRLAVIGAAGCLAPKAFRIETANAAHKPSHNPGGCSSPPCN